MCGILAIVSQDQPVSDDTVDSAVRSLAHRGPDGSGTWFSPNRRTALGHTRLSIIDPQGGAQPIANESGELQLVANGEFYDHDRITAELKGQGHRFRTRSDSEIALHLFECYGRTCLSHLRGEFAFAIWDEANKILFAARDRFGIKPLFYAAESRRFVIASEVKALFAAGVSARWDEDGMFQALHFALHQERSLYQGVCQLPPGHFLIHRDGVTTIHQYWDASFPKRRHAHQPSHDGAPETERVTKLLEAATLLRTRADVPLGCYLSGGVDSAAVLALARRLTGKPITAFSVAFDDSQYDESGAASEMAHHAGAESHQVNVSAADFASVFEDAVVQSEILHYNGHGPARYLLSREVQRAGIKTVLGGEGADELFAGYGFIRPSLSSPRRGLIASLGTIFRFLSCPGQKLRAIASVSPFAARIAHALSLPEALISNLEDSVDTYRTLLHPDFLARHQQRDPYRDFFGQFNRRQFLGREPSKILTYLWLKSHFVNYVLGGERLDMAHAVEVRLPFLDHLLFDYTRTLPAGLLYKNQQNKFLLRRAVANDVTDNVLNGAKKPFFAPPSARQPGNCMHDLVQDLVRSSRFKSIPFFNNQAVLRFLDRLPSTQVSMLDPILHLLASIAVLDRHYHCS